jgi:uncharacterized protein YdcH (DUF465 family)
MSADQQDLAAMFEGLERLIATSSRDWGTYRVDAWLWAVLVGWDCKKAHEHDGLCDDGGAMADMAERHGWDEETVAKARRYRAAVHTIVAAAAQPRISYQAQADAMLDVLAQDRLGELLKQKERELRAVITGKDQRIIELFEKCDEYDAQIEELRAEREAFASLAAGAERARLALVDRVQKILHRSDAGDWAVGLADVRAALGTEANR